MFRSAPSLAAILVVACGHSERDTSAVADAAASEVSDAGVDVRSGDAIVRPEVETSCDPALPSVDASEWRQLSELDPCAPAFVSRDPTKSAPAWKWIPCRNGAANCEELEANWRTEFPGYFGGAWVAADSDGRMDRLLIMRLFDAAHPFGRIGWEEDLFEISSGRALAAVRTIAGKIPLYFDVGVDSIALESFWEGDSQRRAFSFGSRSASELASGTPLAFSFRKEIGFDTCLNYPQTISTTTWACSDPEHRHVARMDIKTGELIAVPVPRALQLITVHGDDAYFRENRNALGWNRIVRFDKDGSLHPLREPGVRHVAAFATDGKTMFWLEAYGDPSPYGSIPQPTVEAWSAPYTNDDVTLAATAKRLAPLERTEYLNNVPGSTAIAFSGIYVAATGPDMLQLVRVSDGRTKVLRNFLGPNRTIFSPVGVSESELWVLTQKTGTNQTDALVRIRLGDW